MTTTLRLSREGQDRARRFLMEAARPLERALYRHEFEGQPPDAALDALAHYRNADGGYGHGLEPDSTTPASSVLNTTVALQTLRHIEVPGEHPLVRGALRYLLDQYDLQHGMWSLMPPAVDDAPHAPWLAYDPDWTRSTVNPTAEAIGHLLTYGALDICRCVDVLGVALSHIQAAREPIEMHELLCVLRLADTPGLPEVPARALAERLAGDIPQVVATDPAAWRQYGLEPLAIAPSPDAAYHDMLAEHIPTNLDDRIAQQGDDGAWWPTWSWGDAHPKHWVTACQAWKGVITIETLIVLRNYGRLA